MPQVEENTKHSIYWDMIDMPFGSIIWTNATHHAKLWSNPMFHLGPMRLNLTKFQWFLLQQFTSNVFQHFPSNQRRLEHEACRTKSSAPLQMSCVTFLFPVVCLYSLSFQEKWKTYIWDFRRYLVVRSADLGWFWYKFSITPTLWGLDWSPSQNHFWNDCGVVWPTHPLNSFFQHRLPIPWNHFSNHWPPLRNHFSRSSGTSKSFLKNDFVCHELLPKK